MISHCQQWLQEALRDPEIRSMIPDDIQIECKTCPFQGFFESSSKKLVLCENNLLLPFIFNHVLKHEAIHVQDSKYESMFENNCFFRACTEIRASKFSNECTQLNEFLRGNFPNFERCVKRRAKLSTDLDSKCRGTSAVDIMWERCFNSELNSNISDFKS